MKDKMCFGDSLDICVKKKDNLSHEGGSDQLPTCVGHNQKLPTVYKFASYHAKVAKSQFSLSKI